MEKALILLHLMALFGGFREFGSSLKTATASEGRRFLTIAHSQAECLGKSNAAHAFSGVSDFTKSSAAEFMQ